MQSRRISIAGLMGLVVLVAVGFAGLKVATPLWASAAYTLTLVGLTLSVLAAIEAQGWRRAYWVGFAVSGWITFAATFGVIPNRQISPPLIHEMTLEWLEPKIHPDVMRSSVSISTMTVTSTAGGTPFTYTYSPVKVLFTQIGHCLVTVLAACSGGQIALLLAARRKRHEAEVNPSSP